MEAKTNGMTLPKALVSVACTIALACMLALLPGCGGSASAGATLSESVDSETANAMVTGIDGSTVTLSLMEGGAPGGQQPGGDQQGDGSGQPPEMPQGDAPSEQGQQGGQPPEMPQGDSSGAASDKQGQQDGQSGDGAQGDLQGGPGSGQMPGGTEATLSVADEGIIYKSSDGTETQASLDDISVGSMLTLTVSGGTNVTKIVVGQGGPDGQGGPGQGSDTPNVGAAATEYDADAETSGETYASTSVDENAVRATGGASVAIDGATVTKTGDTSSSEDSDFYGLNAAVHVYDGAKLTLGNASVTTDSQGSNGVFAYGEGTSATVSDTTISTSKDNSGGIEVSGGAALMARNLSVETQGVSSAAIRSDRGGGTETVEGGTYTTHGHNSPAVYSTADVTVTGAELLAENSEGVVIEGANSVTLDGTDLTGNVNGTTTRTGIGSNVMIYQSMSGDADQGKGTFTMKGGSLTATNGTVFYVTNTTADISLTGVELKSSADSLMTISGNDGVWGTSGSNGGTVSFTASEQDLTGDITVDDDSSLALQLSDGSSYVGAINADGAAGTVSVALDGGSTWKLTGDSYISDLSGDTSGIDLDGHTLYVNGKAWTR